MRLHHVQVAIPAGGEENARSFYADALGMEEIPKPPILAARGGCWFRSGEAELHCGVEEPFSPARKAHPALEVADFETLAERLTDSGFTVIHDDLYPGRRRFYIDDPLGNRIEIIERLAASA